jgi:hypothetical protein
LATLLFYDTPPTKQGIPSLLRALVLPGDISRNAAYLLVGTKMLSWFQDDKLGPILQKACVWSALSSIFILILRDEYSDWDHGLIGRPVSAGFLLFVPSNRPGSADFISLGQNLASMPYWQVHIREEILSWIEIFYRTQDWTLSSKYSYTLRSVWNPDAKNYEFLDEGEEALGLTCAALSKVCQEHKFNFTTSGLNPTLTLLRCTHYVVLRTKYGTGRREHLYEYISPGFVTAFFAPLRDSLLQAATEATRRNHREISTGSAGVASTVRNEVSESVARILEDIASKISNPASPDTDDKYWGDLRHRFDVEIDALEDKLETMSA